MIDILFDVIVKGTAKNKKAAVSSLLYFNASYTAAVAFIH
jgi:hypothetical protein